METKGYVTGPKMPLFVQGVTLNASEAKVLDLVEIRAIYCAEFIKNGVGAGDVSIKIGDTGDYFDLAPGDLLKLDSFGRIWLRNNLVVPVTFKLVMSNSLSFTFENYPRSL